jgi:hypothetical protein
MSDLLERLIAEGEHLAPLGGGDVFAGPNPELQDDYAAWRTRCVTLLRDMGPDAGRLMLELKSDTRGEQFYRASASRVLGVMKAARLLT